MSEIVAQNRERGKRGSTVLEGYAGEDYVESTSWAAPLEELLSDLRHFCDRYSVDFELAAARARTSHAAHLCEEVVVRRAQST
jgi:hypothetical protein